MFRCESGLTSLPRRGKRDGSFNKRRIMINALRVETAEEFHRTTLRSIASDSVPLYRDYKRDQSRIGGGD